MCIAAAAASYYQNTDRTAQTQHSWLHGFNGCVLMIFCDVKSGKRYYYCVLHYTLLYKIIVSSSRSRRARDFDLMRSLPMTTPIASAQTSYSRPGASAVSNDHSSCNLLKYHYNFCTLVVPHNCDFACWKKGVELPNRYDYNPLEVPLHLGWQR